MAKHRSKTMEYSNAQNNRLPSTNGYESNVQDKYKLDFVPSSLDIEKRAYELYQQRGGSDLDNWLEAERLLKEEHAQAKNN